ncbi:MAG: ABC transporter ATP-binding protein [Oscillospiraceae bacterium]|nr:ABC transporter ATP-binding protein [Oscillospiraceae bacterium]
MRIAIRQTSMTYQSPDGEVEALRDVSFDVADGEFVSIVGPSGCGKSTLLSLIAGLERPSAGEILLDGEPVTEPSAKIGFMPQRDQLFAWRTIWSNVTLGLQIRHQNTPEQQAHVHTLLEQYDLAEFAQKQPGQLSGGMRQRCALIRTLATEPAILLLDEPFSALDYQTRLAVSADISRIIRQEHKTAVLVTHDISEAISMSDQIVVLTHRPGTVRAIHDLRQFHDLSPLERRGTPEFQSIFNQIWEELDVNV